MKAIIMVAGKGSRISAHIGNCPKSLMPLNDGTPMLIRNIQMMRTLSIEPVLCVGYEKEQIMDAVKGLPIRCYENPFYSVTNNIANVWFANEEFNGDDDILLLSGDLYYPISFLQKTLDDTGNISMIVDSSRTKDGDYFFHLDEEGYIDKFGPQIPLLERDYESMGITKLSSNFVTRFRDRAIELIRNERYNVCFEEVVLSFCTSKEVKISLIDVAGEFWREYDYYEDYQLVLAHEKRGLE